MEATESGGQSLKWIISDAQEGETYSLAIKVDETNAEQLYSLMLKTTCDFEGVGSFAFTYSEEDYDSIDLNTLTLSEEDMDPDENPNLLFSSDIVSQNYWQHYYGEIGIDQGTLLLQFLPYVSGEYSFNIDDFAISNPDANEEDFGMYDFYNGTSQATPCVAAAVGILSNKYKDEMPSQIKERLLGSATTREGNLEEYDIPGVLNLENLENVSPYILEEDITMEESGKLTIPGYFFGENPKLYINDKQENSIQYDKQNCKITCTRKDLVNKRVESIKVTEGDKEDERYDIFLKSGKLFDDVGYKDDGWTQQITTDGNKIYGFKQQQLYEISPENTKNKQILDNGKNIAKLFENYEVGQDYEDSIWCNEMVYNNGKLWITLNLDYGYMQEIILASYDLNKKDGWKKQCKLKDEYLDYGTTLAVYNSQLYLIGGAKMGEEQDIISKSVYVYDETKNVWNKGIDLPSPRSGAIAKQVGDKLILAFGNEEEVEYTPNPDILIFDGKTWKESKKTDFFTSRELYGEFTSVPTMSLVKDGVIISGIVGDGIAEFVKYNVNTEDFETVNYITSYSNSDSSQIVPVKDKLYALVQEYNYMSTTERETETLKSISIESGMQQVNVKVQNGIELKDQNNNVIKTGTTSYLPGTKLELTANAQNGYKLKTFKVNGQVVNGNKYTGFVTSNLDIEVESELQNNDISKASISGIKDVVSTGQPLTQKITIKNGNTVLREGIDYELRYSNNVYSGKATVTITGKGSYTGKVTKTFKITPKKVTGLKLSSADTKSLKLTWSKENNVTGYKIYQYNSSKKTYKYVGKTISNSYKVKGLKAKTTYKYKVRAYKTIDKKDYFGSYSSILTTGTSTSTPKISKISSKSKKATVQWKKVSGASGYEVYMATSKKGKYSKVKDVKSGKTVKYTKSSLKKKKTYYFKVRTYRTVSGKKVYSSYSSVKSVKIK